MGSIFDHVPRQKVEEVRQGSATEDMTSGELLGAGSTANAMLKDLQSGSIPPDVRKEALIPVGGNFPNKFAVGIHGDWIVVMGQAQGMHSKADALNLAAYLVAMAGGLYEFLPVLKGVEEA